MIINSVKLHNIRSYADSIVSFPETSVVLSGDIGAGKSTILLALEFALFGIMRGSLEGGALLRNGKSNGSVEVCLDVDGKEVIIKRVLKKSFKTVSQDAGYIIIDGKKTEGTAVELKAKILDLLGYPKELITKSKSLIYRYTVYTPQEEMKQILLDEKGYRLDTLRKVFQIDKYKRIRENAEVVVKHIKELSKTYEVRTEDLDEKKKQKALLETELKELKLKSKSLEPDLQKQILLIKEKQTAISSAEEKITVLNDLKKREELAAAAANEKKHLIEGTIFDIDESEKKIFELMLSLKKKTGLNELEAIKQSIANNVATEKDSLKKQISEFEDKLKAVNEAFVRHHYEKESSEKIKKAVAELENCPTCLQPVTSDHKNKINSAENQKIEIALKILEEKSKEKSETETKVSELKKTHEQILEKEKEIITLRSEIAMLDEKNKFKQIILQKQADLKKDIGQLDTEKSDIAERIKNYSGIEEQFKKSKLELEQLQIKEKEVLVKKAEIDKEVEGLNRNLTVIEEEIIKKTEAKNKLGDLKKKQDWLKSYFIDLMEQMEKNVMQIVHSEFDEMFQNWFNILMEGTLSSRLDDDFCPVVEQNGYEVSVGNLSGGERTACALAYRLALNKVINHLITGIKTRDLIILDEPTDGFSSQQLEKVRDVIEQLGVKQTIIVSHEPKIESFVNSIIKITKNEHVSSVG